LTVVYDPKTGHYLWSNAETDPNVPDDGGRSLELIQKQRVVLFSDPPGLLDSIFAGTSFVKVWQGRAGSRDAAVSASINEIRQGLETFEGRG